ncbi:MAG: CBS domain-containing protein [Anaerolineaceae bacterium]|nr:CBS domain-containing protein [Anaerolineaceae bacterium]
MESPIYVIGHVNPDTDSIAAAISYAWLLRERDGLEVIAARAGALNAQSIWVLKTLGIDPPVLITDASPRFESVMRRLDTTTPDQPLTDAWVIASRTNGIAPVINEDGTPYGLITGRSLFDFLSHQVGVKPNRKNLTITEILNLPCNQAANTRVLKFQASTKIKDVLQRLLREEGDEFWVVDEAGRYLGICRQRDLLNPPRLKIIMVDHNERQQSLGSSEEAELLEILDHHRLGNPSTHIPIKMSVDIVGSTSTLVSEKIEEAGLSAPWQIAGVMLAGLLSDTLNLTSPTTTERDQVAAERLSRWTFVRGSAIEHETRESFGTQVLSASAGLATRSPQEVVNSDMKVYSAGEQRFAIAQVEVSSLNEVAAHVVPLNQALDDLRKTTSVDFAMLLVTDVVRGSSRLLLSNPPSVLDELPYQPLPDGTRLAEGVVSRKKQLLPVVLGLLEA